MRQSSLPILIAAILGALPITSQAALYLDSAPNKYGSPAYAPWETSAFAAAAAGTFVNMDNGINPANVGTTDYEAEDVTVYSFGDLGKRLHFIYWMPGETITSLTAKNFQIAMSYVWDGVTTDFYDDYYGQTWLTPSSWIEYSGGVIGSAGFAWWGAYGVNTPEALAADLADIAKYSGDITLYVRMDGYSDSITAQGPAVPEAGATLLLLSCGFLGLATLRRRS